MKGSHCLQRVFRVVQEDQDDMSASGGPESFLQLFERKTLCLRIYQQHNEKLQNHHGGEKHEGIAAGFCGHHRKNKGDYAVHEPVGEASEALTLGANAIGENLADVDPDNGALRKSEARDVADKQPHQQLFVVSRQENRGYTGEA
jgi:hypothetical protein